MTDLLVRRLLVDLESPVPRHWCGGDAFRTALFNALSMSFPVGEQFFIDSVRSGMARLDAPQRARFDAEGAGFIGQEATHRRVHALFNAHLARQGLVNHWEARALARLKRLQGVDVRAWVGLTAATEHFTAILAHYLHTHPQALQGCEPRLATLWLWHASEESEHRATAFDLYRALGGDERWRLRLFRMVTWYFLTDTLRQTLNNLWRDGSWRRSGTWRSAWRFLFGSGGLAPALYRPWRCYFAPDFHPAQQDASAALRWLRENQTQFEVVGQRG
ncbi:MAG: metal-dependent hydrolase [Burkholderiaceae bacterium]